MSPAPAPTASLGGSVLIVEDRQSLREMLAEFLGQNEFQVETAASLAEGLEKFRNGTWHLLLLDLKLPDGSGLDLLQTVRRLSPSQPVILMTAYGTIADSVQAMRSGAVDFIQKPIDLSALLQLVRKSVEAARRHSEPLLYQEVFIRGYKLPLLVGVSEAMAQTALLVQKIAPTDATAFLIGESGTGKELFARTIHLLSGRRNAPFVEVNCAAIPETLMENEFFGHLRGAYTGADATSKGKFDLASGGTLFLDEIGEIPPSMQVKLLKALEEKRFTPIGGNHPVSVDLRIIAATNRNIEEEVRAGAFREDLYFRLAQFPIRIPPLRARRADILPLAEYFVREAAPRFGKTVPSLSEAARAALLEHDWPGNVRELKNTVERAVILGEGESLFPRDIFPSAHLAGASPAGIPVAELREKGLDACLRERLLRLERETIERVLTLAGGDLASAAECLRLAPDELSRRRGEKNPAEEGECPPA